MYASPKGDRVIGAVRPQVLRLSSSRRTLGRDSRLRASLLCESKTSATTHRPFSGGAAPAL